MEQTLRPLYRRHPHGNAVLGGSRRQKRRTICFPDLRPLPARLKNPLNWFAEYGLICGRFDREGQRSSQDRFISIRRTCVLIAPSLQRLATPPWDRPRIQRGFGSETQQPHRRYDQRASVAANVSVGIHKPALPIGVAQAFFPRSFRTLPGQSLWHCRGW